MLTVLLSTSDTLFSLLFSVVVFFLNTANCYGNEKTLKENISSQATHTHTHKKKIGEMFALIAKGRDKEKQKGCLLIVNLMCVYYEKRKK